MERPRRLGMYRRDDRRSTTRTEQMRAGAPPGKEPMRPCAASPSEREGVPDSRHDLRLWTRRVDPKRVARLLECRELTRQQLRPGIMSRPMRESLAQNRGVRVQIDEANARARARRRERLAILLL